MSVHDNLNEYNKCRQRLQDAEGGFIPINPDKDLLDAFMGRHDFSVSQDVCNLDIVLMDNIGQKIYTYPMAIEGTNHWALKMMCLVVKLRNIEEAYWKEKDFRKRRKVYSRMNYIKGELSRYENR